MRNTAKKNLSVLVLVALFMGGALTLSLTLASCELLDIIGINKSDEGNDNDSFTDTTYTIVFSANGGNGNPPNPKIVYSGYSLVVPGKSGLTRSGFTFDGWNTKSSGSGINYPGGSYLTPTASLTLYARWIRGPVTIPGDNIDYGGSLASKLAWLQANARSYGSYILELSANESISLRELYFDNNRTNITITLRGVGSNRTLTLLSNGFSVERGVTLILDNNITLQSRSNNADPLVYVRGGEFKMLTGSALTGSNFRGVEVDSGGTFTMNGGIISGNRDRVDGGGGVAVWNGTFTMNGGTISGNTANHGGGVLVYGNRSSFTMNGGIITGNTAYEFGGGVAVIGATFAKTGGTITGYDTQSNGNRSLGSNISGHAVYAYRSSFNIFKSRETTAGPRVSLFYGSNGSPSGDWDF